LSEIEKKPEEMRESPQGRSMLKLYQGCPRKWYFKYGLGFKLKESADHLIYGSAVHEAQAVFYTSNFSHTKMLDKLQNFLTEGGREDLIPKGLEALELWYDKIGKEDVTNVEAVEVEIEDHLELPNGFKMTLRRDRVLLDKKLDELFINDTKTTGWSLSGTIRNYMYSDQPKLYIASALKDHPEWRDRLSGWRTDCIYMRALKAGGYSKDAIRSQISTFTQQQIDDTLMSYAVQTSDMAYKLQAVIEDGEAPSAHFFQCNEHCLAFNRPCEYFPICHEVDTTTLPPSQFEVDEWLAKGTVLNAFKDLKY